MTNVLALDLATRTGWALREGARIESGVQDFTKKRGESNGMLFLHFNFWLETLCLKLHPDAFLGGGPGIELLVFEQAHHRGGAATEIAVGLTTRVMEFGAKHGIEYTSVHTATLKKFATGSGRASKDEMACAASRCVGRVITDDNEADGLLLLRYAVEEILGEKEWNVQPAAAGLAK